jgi:hypothetical protein
MQLHGMCIKLNVLLILLLFMTKEISTRETEQKFWIPKLRFRQAVTDRMAENLTWSNNLQRKNTQRTIKTKVNPRAPATYEWIW